MARDLKLVINVFEKLITQHGLDSKIETHPTLLGLERLKDDINFIAPEAQYLLWGKLQEILIDYVENNESIKDSDHITLLKNIFSDEIDYKKYE